MAKWNPFEKNILNADPDEFAGNGDARYGVPRDADAGEDPAVVSPGAGGEESSAPESGSMPGEDVPEFGQAQDDTAPEPGQAQDETEPEFGQAQDDTVPEPGQAQDETGPEFGQAQDDTAPGFGQMQDETGPEFGQMQEGTAAKAAAGEDIAGGSVPGHDFDDDEPKFDTQTGERLDRPKKKYPSILLTVAVSALAVGAFVYSVKPGGLPSRNGTAGDPVETETTLAIAVQETENRESGAAQTEREAEQTERGAAQTEKEAEQTESESDLKEDAAGPEDLKNETGAGLSEETEAMAETETEAGMKEGVGNASSGEAQEVLPGEPKFSTDGVTVSASLDVSDLVEEVMPEVVSVTATSVQRVRDFFFGTYQIQQTGAGSGIIIDRDDDYLYIVTDAVIVEHVQDVTVGFSVKKDSSGDLRDEDVIASAEVMGADEESLLALIRVRVKDVHETVLSLIRTADLGDSDTIRPGDSVFAIGNAMGRGLSVTRGIISAVKRPVRFGSSVHEMLQTDASINYGNYGGALLDEEGKVIGINAGKITKDSSEGIGFAYPVNDAKEAIGRMRGKTDAGEAPLTSDEDGTKEPETEKKKEKQPLTLAIAQDESEARPETERGAEDNSGERAEVSSTEAPGSEETDAGQEPGDEAAQGENRSDSEPGQLGIQAGEFSQENRIIYRIPDGVVVADVMGGSGAQAAGLASGDLITGINEVRVASIEELREVLSGLRKGDRVKVSYIRPNEDGAYREEDENYVTVTLS